jgi:hypothetical protein
LPAGSLLVLKQPCFRIGVREFRDHQEMVYCIYAKPCGIKLFSRWNREWKLH